MKISKVTITGADNLTNVDDIIFLSKEYPFVEWGILFSKKKAGQPRYPDLNWIASITRKNLNLSAHLCGAYAMEVLTNGNTRLLDQLSNFSRVQLNFNFSASEYFELAPVIEWAKANPKKAIILQYNKSNAAVLNRSFPENIHLLYDSSGGRGTEIKDIKGPLQNFTGYSGGISNENIQRICELITMGTWNDEVWIDMESGVRTFNQFDYVKVKAVLEIAKKFI